MITSTTTEPVTNGRLWQPKEAPAPLGIPGRFTTPNGAEVPAPLTPAPGTGGRGNDARSAGGRVYFGQADQGADCTSVALGRCKQRLRGWCGSSPGDTPAASLPRTLGRPLPERLGPDTHHTLIGSWTSRLAKKIRGRSTP